MALTSPDNIWTPDSSDNYALTTDLAATADSVQDAITALRGNNAPTVRVANVAGRNAALADHGTPTTSNPLIVFRANAGAGRELEYTTNGTVWHTLAAEEDTGWVSFNVTGGWSGSDTHYRLKNGVVFFRGEIWGGTNGTSFYTMPASLRPLSRSVAVTARTTTPTGYTQWGRISIQTTGVMAYTEMGTGVANGSPGYGLGTLSYPVN